MTGLLDSTVVRSLRRSKVRKRLPHAGTKKALALPALKRVLEPRLVHGALKRSFPRNAGAPTQSSRSATIGSTAIA
jgi:hypothetical protein